MNCDDYLSMLSTLPVEELADGRANDHAAICTDCQRVTRVIVERERNMLVAFGDIRNPMSFTGTAAAALRTSRRRKVALYYRIGLGLAAAITVLYTLNSSIDHSTLPPPEVRETIRLQCLSPEQAAEVVRPYLRRTGRVVISPPSSLGLIHVAGSARDVATAHKVLDLYDNAARSQCAVQVKVPVTF